MDKSKYAKERRDLYYVAVKAFLEKDGKLFIFKDRYGDWDIPGGRIQEHEFNVPLEQVMKRKMREELGGSVRYSLGKPVVFMRHERVEAMLKRKVRIFAVGYKATLLGGSIRLSDQHTESLWVPVKSFNPRGYFEGGWLNGVEEYLKLRRKG
jgi:8-oxo-dGTP pyrophosphatase MutT (NUDIX family)